MYKYITVWTATLHTFTLYRAIYGKEKDDTTRKLIVTSLGLGWLVSVAFWYYYLFTDINIPQIPIVVDILIHGGIFSTIIFYLLKSEIKFNLGEIYLPLGFFFIWLFSVAIPLRYFNIEAYEDFLFKLKPTIVMMALFLISLIIGFVGIHSLSNNSKKKYKYYIMYN